MDLDLVSWTPWYIRIERWESLWSKEGSHFNVFESRISFYVIWSAKANPQPLDLWARREKAELSTPAFPTALCTSNPSINSGGLAACECFERFWRWPLWNKQCRRRASPYVWRNKHHCQNHRRKLEETIRTRRMQTIYMIIIGVRIWKQSYQ